MSSVFIDYVTLMLINMAAGLFILGCYVYRGLDDPDQARWSPAFAMPGLVAVVCGFHMIWNWPLPGPYNSAFGEMSVLLGVLFTGAALALWKGWNLIPLAAYALFAGLGSIVTGVRFINLGLSQLPALTGIGFILTGFAGVLAVPTLYLRNNRSIRFIGAIVLLAASAIWAFIGYGGLWMHMQFFSKWVPEILRK